MESIRGLAALLVVLFHAPGWNTGKEYIGIIQKGYLMVDLFFVISGFLIYKAYGLHLKTGASVWRFQFLRWARLYPVHLIFLLFFLGAVATPWQEMKTAFFEHLFLVQAIGPTGNAITLNYPAWSISVEFYTYLLFALIIYWGERACSDQSRRGRHSLVMFGLIALISWGLLFFNELHGFRDLLRCLAGFLIGCLASALSNTIRVHYKKWQCPRALAPLLFIAIGIYLEWCPSGDHVYESFIYLLTAGLILAIEFSSASWFQKILLSRPLLWLGEISYSLYMAQLACIFLCEEFLRRLHGYSSLYRILEKTSGINLAFPSSFVDGLIKYGFFFILLLVVSSLTYYGIEKPCRELSRRWIRRPKLITP
nr:acyltransferase [Polynucleobacter sp. 15G-AUS-farblos]